MISDLRFALRRLMHSPGFTAVVTLMLAIGIGGNAAIFSLLNAYLLKPLPYPNSGRIVQINLKPSRGFAPGSGGIYLDFEQRATQLSSIAAVHNVSLNLTGIERPARLNGFAVTASYLTTLGIPVALGQDFRIEDDLPGGDHRSVLLADHTWRSHFDADPNVAGRVITLDHQPYIVRGVLSPQTFMVYGVDFLTLSAIRSDAHKQSRNYNYVCALVARLKPEATIGSAQAELQSIKDSLEEEYPDMMKPWGVSARTLQEANFGRARPYAQALLAAVGIVLLVGCANVANLLLARAAGRQGEIAVRSALGASPWQIFRQLLLESLALATLGGVAGIALAALALKPLARVAGVDQLPNTVLEIDARVLLFTLCASVVTGLLFGTLPALKAAGFGRAVAMRDATRSSTSAGGQRVQSMLIAAELALTVTLLVAIGLLLRSFSNALATDPGFRKENVLTFEIARSATKVSEQADYARFTGQVLARIKSLPGVENAAMISSTPMNGSYYFDAPFWRDDQPDAADTYFVGFDSVNGEIFETLGIPLLRGRAFDSRDQLLDAPLVLIISQQVVEDVFGDVDPIGMIVHHERRVWEVVGVVGDITRFSLDARRPPMVYKPQTSWPWRSSYVVRTIVPPMNLARQVEAAVLEIDPEQPIDRVRTLEDTVKSSLSFRVTLIRLIGLFGAVAAFLAGIGVYALTAYTVEQRQREFGIRLAIGADPRSIVRLVMRRGLLIALVGTLLGVGGALALGRLLAFALYEVSPFDPVVTAAAAVVIFGITAVACWRPAKAAIKVNPTEFLRAE